MYTCIENTIEIRQDFSVYPVELSKNMAYSMYGIYKVFYNSIQSWKVLPRILLVLSTDVLSPGSTSKVQVYISGSMNLNCSLAAYKQGTGWGW